MKELQIKGTIKIDEFRWASFPEGTFIYELEPDELIWMWYFEGKLHLTVDEPPDPNMGKITVRKLSLYNTLEIPRPMMERIGYKPGKEWKIQADIDNEKQLITIESMRKSVVVPYEIFKKRRGRHNV